MDLLGDMGTTDQLISARAENEVLQERVKHLSVKVKELTFENEAIKAEVEMYRNEAALPNFSKMALGQDDAMAMDTGSFDQQPLPDDFVRSGDGTFPMQAEISLDALHGAANPLCCALSPLDDVLATGGADFHLSLCQWGPALTPEKASAVVQTACRYRCGAPVIALSFCSSQISGMCARLVAAGCMDGSVHVIGFETPTGAGIRVVASASIPTKHTKYVKAIAWSTKRAILASASADGTVQVFKCHMSFGTDFDAPTIDLEKLETLHLTGPVESLCIVEDTIVCYCRETSYLSYFDIASGFAQSKVNLNSAAGGTTTGASKVLDHQHVSFAVMDIAPRHDMKYLALATDCSRNIIIDFETGKQIRNLYGHSNDGFSQPKIAWSKNGQYLLGNTQDEATICVWDIASSTIVKRLQGHGQNVRDMFSSNVTDTLVTTSFDKTTKLWFAPM